MEVTHAVIDDRYINHVFCLLNERVSMRGV
jgi:hypothetical protein